MNKQPAQSGNMLFILLVCIALLGGLAAIMTRSGNSSDDTGSVEQGIISGADIMKYSAGLETAVQNLIVRGCSENSLNFENTAFSGYSNPSSTTNTSCHIFNPAGAGQIVKFFSNDPAVTGSYKINEAETVNPDLVFITSVPLETCKQINQSLKIANNGTEGPPTDVISGGTKFTGSFTEITGANGEINAPEFSGKKAGCAHQTGTGSSATFLFFHTLHSR